MIHLFFSKVPSFFALSHREAPSKSSQGFTLCFQLLFVSIILLSPEFFMVVHQGSLSFFNCSSRFLSKLWSAKLYSKINMVLNTCLFWGVQAFFISHSKVQLFLPYLLRWCYVILDNFPLGSWFTKFSRVTHLNPSFYLPSRGFFQPINLFVGIILGYISPTAVPKE